MSTVCQHVNRDNPEGTDLLGYRGPSDVSNDMHTSHRHTDWRTCQAAYTISKYVRHHSLASLIGTVKWEGRFCASPHPASPSLVLSRHGRTDVMAMKDALGGWSGGCLMHAQCWTPARWVAAPQCQPTNADSRRGHFRTTLTTGPAGRPPSPRYMGLIAGRRCLDRRP